ncbi:hypothetical protein WJ42_06080 [Burkholderia cepacia]|nr:hypothetical protein WJ42_06080 [Burkholderia cepacia]KWC66912.1 hypothetical protein WL55_19195 [Burkholderia cepacia]
MTVQQYPRIESALFVRYGRQCLGKQIRRPIVVYRLDGTRALFALVGRRAVLDTGRIVSRRHGNRDINLRIYDQFVVTFVLLSPTTRNEEIPQGSNRLIGQYGVPIQIGVMGGEARLVQERLQHCVYEDLLVKPQ